MICRCHQSVIKALRGVDLAHMTAKRGWLPIAQMKGNSVEFH